MRGSGTSGGLLYLLVRAAVAQTTDWPQVSLIQVLGGLRSPLHITHAGDGSGRIFVVEQAGRVRVVKDGALVADPFLDIRGRVSCCGERGLLSVAFPPGYARKGYFYVNYTNLGGHTVVARYDVTANPDVADPSTEKILLMVNQPYENHNGGQLAFSPKDGYLYIGMGDGGSAGDPLNNGQTPSALLGKILRIDVESGATPYQTPASNPFVKSAGYRPEIWAWGVRNPWRFSFDRQTGDLYIGEVGQDRYEEIDFQPAASPGGENYGWNLMEGTHCYRAGCSPTSLVLPVAEYDHSQGCSVTGGFVYRGLRYSGMQGVYFYGDYCSGRIWGLRRSGSGWESRLLVPGGGPISTFGEDESGELYLANYASGEIFLLASGPPAFSRAAVVNAASYVEGLSPGAIATVFGSGLTKVSGVMRSAGAPLPLELAGTSLSVSGTKAPLMAVANVGGQEQINFQVPYELGAPGVARIVISNNGLDSAPVDVAVTAAQPGVFALDGATGAIVHGADSRLVSEASPADRGEIVTLYGTGFGPVGPAPKTGAAAASIPLSYTAATPVVTVGRAEASQILFSGLSPGSVGLGQINFRVPENAPPGLQDVVVTVGAQASRPVKMAVR